MASRAPRAWVVLKWLGRRSASWDLKRKAGYGMSWGVEAHLLSADEARRRIPMLSDRILGALYVPSDIQTKATRPAEAMAREAERETVPRSTVMSRLLALLSRTDALRRFIPRAATSRRTW